jgi:RNA polymerase sigma factor (sigma-70 family)
MADDGKTPSLIKGCLKGKRRAQYELYRHCYSLLMPVCMRYEHNEEDARAVLNEGFLKILDNLETYKQEVPFDAWCKRIMINTLIDAYRKKRNKPHTCDFEEWSHNGELGISLNDALEAFTAEDLEKMLQTLPDTSRKVFNMYVVDGFSHKEIADKLNISEGTSKWHVNHARSKLQQIMKDMMNPSQKLAL